MDFLIKNGNVYNPRNHTFEQKDVALVEGMIAESVPGHIYRQVIDADGCIVTTGLIDYHVHYFLNGSENGVNPDANSFCCGVTTAVDGGTCGTGSYELYHSTVMAMSQVNILNYLLIASGGQSNDRYPENLDPELFDEERIRYLFRKYPDNLVAIKTRISNNIIASDKVAASLKRTIEIAEAVKTRVVVHVTDCSVGLDELAKMLRPGDVICHIYQGKGINTCIDAEGHVLKGLKEARKNGVLFDASNGRSNYDLEVCQKAIADGFYPDVISSDINKSSDFIQPLHSLPRVLSKYLDMGMELADILDCATINPAKLIGREELGSMDPGTVADVCILKLKEKTVQHEDIAGNTLIGNHILVPMMTFQNGECVYCQADFN